MNTFCHTLFISLLMCIQVMNTFAQKPASQEIPDSATIREPAAQPFHPLRFAGRKLVSSVTLPDSADIIKNQKKNIWRAGAEVIGLNIGLNAFDRYVLNGRYAQISWNTIKNNFSHGFEWDNDHLNTNMFAHPYNGSLYFNAGRSNGFNFWQSELFAIGGSAMWEMCMEREYPSTNDIIATPIGGAAIGEVLYRTSDMITDDRTSGGERFGRELAAFVINPTRGLTRILTGDAWKRRSTSGRRFGIPPVSMNVALGGRYLTLWDNDEGTQAGAVAEIEIEYGDRYAEQTRTPYDWFSFIMELQAVKTQPLLSRVEIIGRLFSKEVINRKKLNVSVGMYQHFDFFDSDTIKWNANPNRLSPCVVPYKLGTPASFGAGTMFRYQPAKSMVFNGFIHANAVILGGILTDFYRDYHRNYNWGSGFSIKAGLDCVFFDNKLLLSLRNQFYQLYTWKGYDQKFDWSLTPHGTPVNVQGDKSHSTFNHFEAELSYKIGKRMYLAAEFGTFIRNTRYKIWLDYNYYPRIESKQINAELTLKYVI